MSQFTFSPLFNGDANGMYPVRWLEGLGHYKSLFEPIHFNLRNDLSILLSKTAMTQRS